MANYHVNLATGQTGICKAEPGKCPVQATDGAEHFSDRNEAKIRSEEVLTQKSNIMKSTGKSGSVNNDKKSVFDNVNENEIFDKINSEKIDIETHDIQARYTAGFFDTERLEITGNNLEEITSNALKQFNSQNIKSEDFVVHKVTDAHDDESTVEVVLKGKFKDLHQKGKSEDVYVVIDAHKNWH